jgi:hypothetical protein
MSYIPAIHMIVKCSNESGKNVQKNSLTFFPDELPRPQLLDFVTVLCNLWIPVHVTCREAHLYREMTGEVARGGEWGNGLEETD